MDQVKRMAQGSSSTLQSRRSPGKSMRKSPGSYVSSPRSPPSKTVDQTDRRERHVKYFAYYAPKFFLICFALVFSCYFEVNGEPPMKKESHRTDDLPVNGNDPSKGGEYQCGCDLPVNLQTLKDSKEREKLANRKFNLNVCYDPSVPQDMNILMFSNSSAEKAETVPRIKDFDARKMVDGYMIEQQAHAIRGPSNLQLGKLYTGGKKQHDIVGSLQYFHGAQFQGFPPDFLRLAFTYCSNCTQDSAVCGIGAVNEVFNSTLNAERWGSCFPVEENECDTATYKYQAMCTIYPTETVPSTFPLKTFLKTIYPNKTLKIGNVTAVLSWGTSRDDDVSWNITLQPSTVYVNHSKVTVGKIRLSFLQAERESATWIDLARLFPSLDVPCASLSNITAYTGATLCNLYTNGRHSLNVKCLDQSVLSTGVACQQAFNRSTLENAAGLCGDLGITPSPSNSQCACRDKEENVSMPPYLATWSISAYIRSSNTSTGDPLNWYMYSRLLKDQWATQAGACTNTHPKVIPYNPGEKTLKVKYSEKTILLQAECLPKRGNENETRSTEYQYCWLTGKYRNFTDLGNDEWKQVNLPEFYNDTDSEGRFVCFKITQQHRFVWIFLILGGAFGWAGSVDLIFNFVKWFRQKVLESRVNKEKLREPDVRVGEERI